MEQEKKFYGKNSTKQDNIYLEKKGKKSKQSSTKLQSKR